MREIHRHLDIEDLESYAMGTGSVENAVVIEEQLLICGECRDRLQEADEYVLAMQMASRQLLQNERPVERRQWRFAIWFPAAVVFCSLLLAVVWELHPVASDAPPIAVSLTALRNRGDGNVAPEGRELLLHPDLIGLAGSPAYRLEIVDLTGHTVRQSSFARAQQSVRLAGLGAGQYFVRVYLPGGELLREYGLDIR